MAIFALVFTGRCAIDFQAESQARAKALAEAKAVRVLPDGVEEAWSAYMDRQLDRAVQPRGDMIKVIGIGGIRQFVSRSAPVRVTCSGLTALHFGLGEEGAMVFLYDYGHQIRGEEGPPPLGVHPDSVAARALRVRLCDHISDRLQDIMTAPEPLPTFSR